MLPRSEIAERMRSDERIARVTDALADVPGCWLVGGAVRDLLLGLTPLDLDVVVEGDAPAAARRAAARLDGEAVAHERFGTATVVAGGLRFDLVTARREAYPAPGALPEVEPAPLDEDLARRDFSIHALALGLSGESQAVLREAPGGLADLEARRLRVLHDRSFPDDPTRLLRLVRYAARLGLAIEAHTESLARAAIGSGALGSVSGARIGDELRLLLGEHTAVEALKRAAALGLDRALHPSLDAGEAANAAAGTDVPAGARRDLVLLAAGSTTFSREDLRAWLDRLEWTAGERDAIEAAALDARELAAGLARARRPSEIAALARDRPPEQLAMAALLGARPQVQTWDRDLRGLSLEISGDDLVAAGVPEGPRVGRGLDAALAARLDGDTDGREDELRVALEAATAD